MKKSKILMVALSAVLCLTPVYTVYAEGETESIVETESTESVTETESESIPESEDNSGIELASLDPGLNDAYPNKQVYDFVTRMYEITLNRAPDEIGLREWYDSLVSGKNTGAEIMNGFFFSKEFMNAAHDDETYVLYLYRALFGREADQAGFDHWMKALNDGMSRRYVCAGFIGSAEYGNMCASYGIQPGGMTSSENRDKNQQITAFVNRFYNLCLNRNGDSDGLNQWTGDLISKKICGADIAGGFFFSEEMKNRSLTNAEYIEILYKALLNRASDGAGKADWLKQLDSGVTRHQVTIGFVHSAEFSELCQSYGIERGVMAGSEELTDRNPKLTVFLADTYQTCFGRKAQTKEINQWVDLILNKGMIAKDVVKTIFTSDEYTKKNKDDATFIQDVYKVALNRIPSAEEIDVCVKKLKNDSREKVIEDIVMSKEGQDTFTRVGIAIVPTGWVESNGKYYYYENSKKKTGWLRMDGQRYYLNPSKQGAREVGWAYVDGYKLYFNENGQLVQDVESLIGPQSSYYIKVYKWGNYLTVFAKDGNKGYIIPVKSMICSCGNNTPTGDYRTPNKFRWLTMVGGSKAQWCTQILGSYLFHSVPYRVADPSTLYTDLMYNYLGTTQSLGCIRLQAGDAKWIYDNCSLGTLVNIDPNVNSGPFDKPAFTPLPSWHTWDPTDPTVRHLCQQHGCH